MTESTFLGGTLFIIGAIIGSYGMSKSLGTRKYGGNQEQVFLGKSYGSDSKDYSDGTATLIDNEIKAATGRVRFPISKTWNKNLSDEELKYLIDFRVSQSNWRNSPIPTAILRNLFIYLLVYIIF